MLSATESVDYAYDALNHLISVDLPGGSLSYAYDPAGQRIAATVAGVETRYLWDPLSGYGDVVAETDDANVVQTSYILANGMLLGQISGADTRYRVTDVQGSTRLLTDPTGAVTSSCSYDAFGTLKSTGDVETRYLYTGQQFDDETGLYSLRARYYNPGVGRFTARDVYEGNYGSELNRYVYAMGNPIMGSDPSGLNVPEMQATYTPAEEVGTVTAYVFPTPGHIVSPWTIRWLLPLIIGIGGEITGLPDIVRELLEEFWRRLTDPGTTPEPAPRTLPQTQVPPSTQSAPTPAVQQLPQTQAPPATQGAPETTPELSTPTPTPSNTPTPSPTPTPEPEEHFVLGFFDVRGGRGNQLMQSFWMNVTISYRMAEKRHVAINFVDDWEQFTRDNFERGQARDSDRIHFNLQEIKIGTSPVGVNYTDFADNYSNGGVFRSGDAGRDGFYVTAWELWHVRDKYCNKTYFYENGGSNATPSLSAGQEICGITYTLPAGHPSGG
jgi:RHS repeat-associated protein